MANEYIVGQVVVLTDVITDPANNDQPIDDATDAVTVYKPDGTTTTPSVAHSGATGSGTYKAQLQPDLPGWWEYVFSSTGDPGTGKGRGLFYVSPIP